MSYSKIVRMETGAVRDDMIRRDADGAFIPADPANTDWQAYQAWLEAGNMPADLKPTQPQDALALPAAAGS